MMMSELHLELAELLDVGVDMWDRDEVYDAACERDFDLAATCIHDHWRDYVAFIEAWFLEDLLNEQVNA